MVSKKKKKESNKKQNKKTKKKKELQKIKWKKKRKKNSRYSKSLPKEFLFLSSSEIVSSGACPLIAPFNRSSLMNDNRFTPSHGFLLPFISILKSAG